ncbi:MAG: HEAT repeat domain-containing protein [Sandaracinaceae bacterium]|nr:MAG: HEAT repeat domain-containing protein [Sandaracinaceae bacterium]
MAHGDSHGMLLDPEGAGNPGVSKFEAIAHTPCLVLLGEPGIGKSTALADAHKATTGGAASFLFKLGEYKSEKRLEKKLFGHTGLRAALDGGQPTTLYLDALDECLVSDDVLADVIRDGLDELGTDGLTLRIACQTAFWNETLATNFQALWGAEDNVGVYEMLPLRWKDVFSAATSEGLDPETFANGVTTHGMGPLAARPLTLRLLLNVVRSSGEFPQSRRELFTKATRLLAQGARSDGLESEHLLCAARRLAGLSVLCGRSFIWHGPDLGEVPPEALNLSEVPPGEEPVEGSNQIQTGSGAMRRCLQTGMFTGRDENSMTWAHRSFAEFMAAEFLRLRSTPQTTVWNLLRHPADHTRIVPQLSEVAAWLSASDRQLFERIAATDPMVLLRADASELDDRQRSVLVAALLDRFERREATDADLGLRAYYGRLGHADLAAQLEPYIQDASGHVVVRRFSIAVAERCGATDLVPALIAVCQDTSDNDHIRSRAAHAVASIGDEAAREALRPALSGELGPDPQDELRGAALRALWPDLLSAEDLFASLTPPGDQSFFGAYGSFIGKLGSSLQPGHLSVGLKWLSEQPPSYLASYSLSQIHEHILAAAFLSSAEHALSAPLAATLSARLQMHDKVEVPKGTPTETRRSVLDLLLSDRSLDVFKVVYHCHGLLRTDDFDWLIARLNGAGELEDRWLELVTRLIHSLAELPEAIRNAVVAAGRADLLQALEQREANTEKVREREAGQARRDEEQQRKRVQTVETALAHLRDGKDEAWYYVFVSLAGQVGLPRPPGEWTAEILEVVSQAEAVAAAAKYLATFDDQRGSWLAKENAGYSLTVIAGRAAAVFIAHVDPTALGGISAQTWERWVGAVVHLPGDDGDAESAVLRAAIEKRADEVAKCSRLSIMDENRRSGSAVVLKRFSAAWCSEVEEVILDLLRRRTLELNAAADCVRAVHLHNPVAAEGFLKQCVSSSPSGDDTYALLAVLLLLEYDAERHWDQVWSAVNSNAEFSNRVLDRLAERVWSGGFDAILSRVGPDRCADLYLFIESAFPPSVAAKRSRPGDPASLREGVLGHLSRRGTLDAVEALERLAREGKAEHIKWVLAEARRNALAREWSPVQPLTVLTLLGDSDLRVVETAEDLLGVVMESLSRLEAELQGETPASRDIWDERANKKFRPLGENDFSDYVKRHLQRDVEARGVIVNREVEIWKRPGASGGKRTDIHVNAAGAGPGGRSTKLTVIVEVKGCWHAELETAMETQLLQRYLKKTAVTCGVYLIGWFNCPEWNDPTDSREKKAPKSDLADARKQFDTQAAALSGDGFTIRAFVMDAKLPSA